MQHRFVEARVVAHHLRSCDFADGAVIKMEGDSDERSAFDAVSDTLSSALATAKRQERELRRERAELRTEKERFEEEMRVERVRCAEEVRLKLGEFRGGDASQEGEFRGGDASRERDSRKRDG